MLGLVFMVLMRCYCLDCWFLTVALLCFTFLCFWFTFAAFAVVYGDIEMLFFFFFNFTLYWFSLRTRKLIWVRCNNPAKPHTQKKDTEKLSNGSDLLFWSSHLIFFVYFSYPFDRGGNVIWYIQNSHKHIYILNTFNFFRLYSLLFLNLDHAHIPSNHMQFIYGGGSTQFANILNPRTSFTSNDDRRKRNLRRNKTCASAEYELNRLSSRKKKEKCVCI